MSTTCNSRCRTSSFGEHPIATVRAGELARVVDPVLVICGDRDEPSLQDAARLASSVAEGELAVVPNSSHGAATKPLFWVNVLDFLGRHDA